MPTPTLHLSSPYENIFETTHSKLKIFGCLYYPWLRPHTSHKLESRSKPPIFLGYFQTQSAYYFFDPSTFKIYVSCHVKFVETLFPFSNLSQQLPHPSPHLSPLGFPHQFVSSYHPSKNHSIHHLQCMLLNNCPTKFHHQLPHLNLHLHLICLSLSLQTLPNSPPRTQPTK